MLVWVEHVVNLYQKVILFYESNVTQILYKFSYNLVEEIMNLNEPKVITFWIAVVIAVVALIAYFVTIPVLSGISFWLLAIAFVVLAAGNVVKGM